ncbi:MAG: hypothetical protein LBH73_07570 [Spirochaetaceae bacterium]|jgi:hypothetical protein|nr:hypothetical protein [Spirochaetaceae bacterium]
MTSFQRRGAAGLLALSLSVPLFSQEVFRGEIRVDMEPVYAAYVDEQYPLDTESTHRRALEEAALFFSAMLYGWSFDYEIGERARRINETFELEALGSVAWGDSRLRVTDARLEGTLFFMWVDYRLDETQVRRMRVWRSGTIQNSHALGYGPVGGPVELGDWMQIKKTALEDAARAAVRAMLQGSERNRPKHARGYIALDSFPVYRLSSGRWQVNARFRIEITEIIPFSVY